MNDNAPPTGWQLLEEAMAVTTRAEADAMLERMVTYALSEHADRERSEIEEICRQNLAYFAGYYSHETRLRIEELFNCVHPALGAAKDGQLTPAEVFARGVAMGEASLAKEEGRLQ